MALNTWAQMVADAPESAGFSLLPEGKYPLKVVKVEIRTSNNTGKEGFNLTTEVISGEYKGRKVFQTLWISPENPQAMSIFFANLLALGIPREFFKRNPSNAEVMQAINGSSFLGTVTIRTWNGKDSNDLKYFDKLEGDAAFAGGGAPDPLAGFAPAPSASPTPAPLPSTPAPTPAPVVAEAPAVAPEPAVEAPSVEAPADPFPAEESTDDPF